MSEAPQPHRLSAPLSPAGVAAVCGLLYLYTRFRYFQGYAVAAQGRLVSSWGCGHPKPTHGGWVQDASPGARLHPFSSPPAPICLWPHQLFPRGGGWRCSISQLSWPCPTVFSPHAGWGRCTPALGCSGCCWGWRWLGCWHISSCPAPWHGRQCWHGPSSCLEPGERGQLSQNPLFSLGGGEGVA